MRLLREWPVSKASLRRRAAAIAAADPTAFERAVDGYLESFESPTLRRLLLRSVSALDEAHRAMLATALAVDVTGVPSLACSQAMMPAAIERRCADGTLRLRVSHFLRAYPAAIGELDAEFARGLIDAVEPGAHACGDGAPRACGLRAHRPMLAVIGGLALLIAVVGVGGGFVAEPSTDVAPRRATLRHAAIAGDVTMPARTAAIGADATARWRYVDDAVGPGDSGAGAIFRYRGRWEHISGRGDGRSNGTSSRSWHRGDAAMLRFSGSRIRLYGVRGPSGGFAAVALDGKTTRRPADFYAQRVRENAVVYDSGALRPGVHDVLITVAGRRAVRSRGDYVNLDGAAIMPSAP